jgi:hypothetical protein
LKIEKTPLPVMGIFQKAMMEFLCQKYNIFTLSDIFILCEKVVLNTYTYMSRFLVIKVFDAIQIYHDFHVGKYNFE